MKSAGGNLVAVMVLKMCSSMFYAGIKPPHIQTSVVQISPYAVDMSEVNISGFLTIYGHIWVGKMVRGLVGKLLTTNQ